MALTKAEQYIEILQENVQRLEKELAHAEHRIFEAENKRLESTAIISDQEVEINSLKANSKRGDTPKKSVTRMNITDRNTPSLKEEKSLKLISHQMFSEFAGGYLGLIDRLEEWVQEEVTEIKEEDYTSKI